MSDLLTDLIPTNLQQEKEKFFQDFSYNPQLVYVRDFSFDELHYWGEPIPTLTAHAQKMLNEKLQSPPDDEVYVDQKFIQDEIEKFNQRYQLTQPIITEFSEHQVTRCHVNNYHIYFQLPIRYTKEKLADLLRHELETHILRSINQTHQNWGDQKIDGVSFRKTEEGLAGLHTHLFRKNKIIRKSYLTYLAVSIAQQSSFSTVFHTLLTFQVSPATAWNIALRTKRGMADTSQAGGLTKDIAYLEGTISVWNWLMQPKNHAKDLYIGRVGLKDLARVLPFATTDQLKYPYFILDYQEYLANITEIGRVNRFSQLEMKL